MSLCLVLVFHVLSKSRIGVYFLQHEKFISRWRMIIWKSVVLRRTLCGDIDYLSGSHHRNHAYCQPSVDVMSLVVILIGRQTCDAIVINFFGKSFSTMSGVWTRKGIASTGTTVSFC